jgi:hypothetical protein
LAGEGRLAAPRPGCLKELQRHHLFRVAATHVVVGWLVIQVVTVIFPLLQFPPWPARDIVLLVLVLVGFPIVLVLAWGLQTPRDERGASASVRRRSLRTGFTRGGVGVLIAMLAGAV